MTHVQRQHSERRVIVLGSTGSIGTQTIGVIEHLNALHARGEWGVSYRVVGLATGRNGTLAREQGARLGCGRVVVAEDDGADAAERLVRETPSDLVVAAMVGEAGLPATLAAAELGIDIALANKETLVAAGSLIVPAARASGARLLPVDSEHSAIWQGLGAGAAPPMVLGAEVARVILTASGGPFRSMKLGDVYHVKPEAALKHPNWTMGRKVTIDSATMMNKALEVIEAHWLFGVGSERIGVMIHPTSIVHSLVEWADGSVMAQLGSPDMRGPIQHALTWPGRAAGVSKKITLADLARLEFYEADEVRFEALALARRVIERGETSGAIFNAANEEAVEAFVDERLPFGAITRVVREVLEGMTVGPVRTIEDVRGAGAAARRRAREIILHVVGVRS